MIPLLLGTTRRMPLGLYCGFGRERPLLMGRKPEPRRLPESQKLIEQNKQQPIPGLQGLIRNGWIQVPSPQSPVPSPQSQVPSPQSLDPSPSTLNPQPSTLMFLQSPPKNPTSVRDLSPGWRRCGTVRSMQGATQFQPQIAVSGLTLVESGVAPVIQVVGVSAAWRKLLLQAEMAAPHVQVATLEGEHGTGKYTLARFLFSRSPLSGSVFQRRDAREWLATDADPSALAGMTYLDRVDLLAPPGQGLLLGVLKAPQDRPPGKVVVLASAQTSLRNMAGQGLILPDLAFRLTAVR